MSAMSARTQPVPHAASAASDQTPSRETVTPVKDESAAPINGGVSRAPHATVATRMLKRLSWEADALLAWLRGRVRRHPNDLCLRVFALRRSGHHAIVNWIRCHFPERHWFLNHCRVGVSPFQGADLSTSVVRGSRGEHKVFHTRLELAGWHAYKGVLIYNLEEVDLSVLGDSLSVHRETAWVGPSARRADVIILRDPFNLLASKLKWAYGRHDRPSKPSLAEVATAKELWKVYAREYLGLSRYLTDRVEISYNHWFVSRDYRDQLAGRLGFENHDSGVQEVARWGPSTSGDSFDGLRYDGKAQEMRVLERWRTFEGDPFYRELCGDRELHELSERIFGEIEGIEALRP